MTEPVVAGALALAALNAPPALLGAATWRLFPPARMAAEPASASRFTRSFWATLRLAQAAAVLYAVAVGVLAAAGRYSSEHLFYLYALLPLAVAFVAEQLRVASAQTILDQRGLENAAAVGVLPEAEQHEVVGAIVRREVSVMAISALVVVFLALRAASTAHGF